MEHDSTRHSGMCRYPECEHLVVRLVNSNCAFRPASRLFDLLIAGAIEYGVNETWVATLNEWRAVPD